MKTGPLPFGLKISIISRAFRKKMDEKACAMGLTAVQLRVLGAVSLLEESGETDIHQNDLEKDREGHSPRHDEGHTEVGEQRIHNLRNRPEGQAV